MAPQDALQSIKPALHPVRSKKVSTDLTCSSLPDMPKLEVIRPIFKITKVQRDENCKPTQPLWEETAVETQAL